MAIFHFWRHKGNLWLVGADHPGGNNNSAVNQTRWMIVSGVNINNLIRRKQLIFRNYYNFSLSSVLTTKFSLFFPIFSSLVSQSPQWGIHLVLVEWMVAKIDLILVYEGNLHLDIMTYHPLHISYSHNLVPAITSPVTFPLALLFPKHDLSHWSLRSHPVPLHWPLHSPLTCIPDLFALTDPAH